MLRLAQCDNEEVITAMNSFMKLILLMFVWNCKDMDTVLSNWFYKELFKTTLFKILIFNVTKQIK